MKACVILLVLIVVKTCWCKDYVLRDLGCWKDTSDRAIPSIDSRLQGNYKTRPDALQKCAQAAAVLGYSVFAVQDGGWCASGPTAGSTYKKYGPSGVCQTHGKGGPWANQVYEIDTVFKVEYQHVGCFKDTQNRAIRTVERRFVQLRGYYKGRTNAIEKCARIAASLNLLVFAVQDGGWCATSPSAESTYNKYGYSQACKGDGKGGPWANDVYQITSVHKITLSRLGCFADQQVRALPFLERPEVLPGEYQQRPQAIEQCARYASGFGHPYIGIQNGGSCMAGTTYRKYGTSTKCKTDSKGGPWANEVFKLNVEKLDIPSPPLENDHDQFYINSLGCWRDTEQRAIPLSLEGDPILLGNYQNRVQAVKRCAQAAMARGFNIIGVQHGGQCWSGGNARNTYRKYRRSKNCAKGKGGAWANNVYEINVVWDPIVTGLGCFRDTKYRAMFIMENGHPLVTGAYQKRSDAVRKCARAVGSFGFSVFGVQNGGQCTSSPKAASTYMKYGRSDKCKYGKGGAWANSVYKIMDTGEFFVESKGCWADDSFRTIPIVEGEGPEFLSQPVYKSRADAFGKCARYAKAHNFSVFALQDGGQCFTSAGAEYTYKRIGPSQKCKDDGKGGPWANQVYAILPPPVANEVTLQK